MGCVGYLQDKQMNPSADTIAMIIKKDTMPATGAYETVESTPSRMKIHLHMLLYIYYIDCQYMFYFH